MAKIKTNDKIIVIAGKDKGKQGTVLKVIKNTHVVVEGVNRYKKHQKGNPQKGTQSSIVDKEKPIHISNVAIFNQETNKADKVRYLINDQGKKVRVYASNQEAVDI